jgi:two-component system chemotaxis sensor kinase CheA
VSLPERAAEADFQRLFAAEAEGRLDTLVDQLLELEKVGPSSDLMASLFREAHTVKGGAAVVGLASISRVAHALEDLLEEVRGGRRGVDAALVDAVLGGVDAIRTLIPRALAGEDHEAQAVAAEQRLRAALGAPGAAPGVAQTAASPVGPPPATRAAGPAQTVASPVGPPATTRAAGPAQVAASRAASAGRGRSGDAPTRRPASRAPRRAEPAAPSPAGPPEAGPAPSHSGDEGRWTGREMVQLPVHRLDELVRSIGEASAATLRLGSALLQELERDPSTLSEYRNLTRSLNELQELALRARMIPVMQLAPRLRRAVRDLGRETGRQVRFETRGEDAEIDRGVLDRLADPLLHLIRNAVDHGIEPPEERRARGKPVEGTVRLHAMQLGSEVIIAVSDDGRGIDLGRVREMAGRTDPSALEMDDEAALYLIFRSGLSTATRVTGVSGRGVGLDAVRASLNAVRGRIEVHSDPGIGTEFRIAVPITMATLRCLVVAAGGQRYAIPLHSVRAVLGEQPPASAAGRAVTMYDGRPVPIASLASILGTGNGSDGPAVVVSGLTRSHALRVDHLIDQRDVVVKGLGELIPRLPAVAGAGVEADGSILLVLEAAGLIERARRGETPAPHPSAAPAPGPPPEGAPAARPAATILVVDDALTVRELQRSIFEHAGYRVLVAANGEDALQRMAEERPDLVLTDIEMPVLDGFGLTERIRANASLASVPVIILTSRGSEESRRRGLDVGADGYIVKSGFDQNALLSAVERLLGSER